MAISPKDRETIYNRITTNTQIDTDIGNSSISDTEDAFKTLSVWEEAVALHKRGLTWSQAATELISACEKYPRD